jgi:hypothetical protein
VEWPVERLKKEKLRHESRIKKLIGVPAPLSSEPAAAALCPREFAFIRVNQLQQAYREFIEPMLKDKGLTSECELGILMCGSPLEGAGSEEDLPQWTVFVEAKWLRWFLDGQKNDFPTADEVPKGLIYGQVAAWPDSFREFLHAMVATNTTFGWSRTPQGYLVLGQVPRQAAPKGVQTGDRLAFENLMLGIREKHVPPYANSRPCASNSAKSERLAVARRAFDWMAAAAIRQS